MPTADIFIAKLNPNRDGYIYSTYLGGLGYEQGSSIATDNAGNAYVTGYTSSLDFPVANALQPIAPDSFENKPMWLSYRLPAA